MLSRKHARLSLSNEPISTKIGSKWLGRPNRTHYGISSSSVNKPAQLQPPSASAATSCILQGVRFSPLSPDHHLHKQTTSNYLSIPYALCSCGKKASQEVSKVSKPAAKPALKASKPAKKVAKKVSKQPVESEPSKSYKELIVEGLTSSKDRKGTSRPALKKFIREHYPKLALSPNFDLYFNNAVKKGVESGDFDQPKGPSGTLKLTKHPVKKSPSPQEKTTGKKVSSPPAELTYKEMIANAIAELNNGKGASRSALKKYVRDHNPSTNKSSSNFDHLFSTALKKGVDSGEYVQPKGPTGIVKIVNIKTKGKNAKNHTTKKTA